MERKFIGIVVGIIIITASTTVAVSTMLQENTPPVVTITADHTSGKAPLTIKFSCDCYDPDGTIEKVKWRFGDGTASTESMIHHTYHWRGQFSASCTVWDDQGKTAQDTLEIQVFDYHEPVPIIRTETATGPPPFQVSFSGDGSDVDGYISSYHWDFGDGTSSDKQYPTHWYNETGTYYAWLTVTDSDGEDASTCCEITVIPNQPPVPQASANVRWGNAPLTVGFSGEYEDKDSSDHTYLWFFEDCLMKKNSWSDQQHPSHTFWFPGTYEVSYTVTDDSGESMTQYLDIVVYESLFSKTIKFLEDQLIQRAISRWFPVVYENIIYRMIAKMITNRIDILA